MTFMHSAKDNHTASVVHMYDHAGKASMKPVRAERQSTIAETVSFSGVGVHSGVLATLFVHPADVNAGYVFTQRIGGQLVQMAAQSRHVVATDMATVLSNGDGFQVSTIEHVMAALRGIGIDNAILEIDGPEVPILDGSAAEFAAAFLAAGISTQAAPKRYIRVLKPVMIDNGAQRAELWPHADGFRVEAEIDFPTAVIGQQAITHNVSANSFMQDIAAARTFGFVKDLEKVQAMGFALGSSLENTVAIDGDRVVNPEGLRFRDEFVRHKVLDAVGDLALAGLPLLATYRVKRANHKINGDIVRALLADTSAWDVVEAGASQPAESRILAAAE